MPYASANGLTLCYQTDGKPDGTPLLLIMGLGMQLTSWPPELIAELVARDYYVIRFDNRDTGLSAKLGHLGKPNLPFAFVKSVLHLPLNSPYKLYDMARDALCLLDALQIEQFHVAGVSMGGMIAQILAALYPQRVLSLTSIMSTSGRPGLPGPSRAVRKVILSRPKNPRDPEQVVSHFVRTLQMIGSPAYPSDPDMLRERIAHSMRRSFYPEGTARQMLAIAASGSRTHLLHKIRQPALVIHGNQDPLLPLACGRDTAAAIPGSQLRVIEGMGHDLPHALLPQLAAMVDAQCRGQAVPEPLFIPRSHGHHHVALV